MSDTGTVIIEFVYVCAHCDVVIRKEKAAVSDTSMIAGEKSVKSHGVCPPCYKKWYTDLEVSADEMKQVEEESNGQGLS